MTAIDKANELIVKVLIKFERITLIEAKKIVLMTVDEIIEYCPNMDKFYWQEVKGKIEKL